MSNVDADLLLELRVEFARQLVNLDSDAQQSILNELAESGWGGMLAKAETLASNSFGSDDPGSIEVKNYLQSLDPQSLVKFWIMPTATPPRSIMCEMNNNNHFTTVHRYFECGALPAHKFCLQHNFINNQCPHDGTILALI